MVRALVCGIRDGGSIPLIHLMNKEETMRLLKNINCKSCRYLLIAYYSENRKDPYCGKLSGHEETISIKRGYCDLWKRRNWI